MNLLQLLQKLFIKDYECLAYSNVFIIKYTENEPFQILNQSITDYFYSYQIDNEKERKQLFDQLESRLKHLEIVINMNQQVEANLFGISPFNFNNLSFIVENKGNKSLKIISKLLLDNSNFDIIQLYSGFLFIENFQKLKKQINEQIQDDYLIESLQSFNDILCLKCFEDFSAQQKIRINSIVLELRQIKIIGFNQNRLFCECVLQTIKSSLSYLYLLSNYVEIQSILGDDKDEKFVCNCNMLNQVTKHVTQNQKNLKIFKFQVYMCKNVEQQLQESEDYFGLSDKLNLFLLEISYVSKKNTNFRKLIYGQLKRNARNVSTLNLQDDLKIDIFKLNLFKKLKRIVCINII
ncbi:hypothetical protein TTHERM_000951701 (macronuclear) [Tetrahymena thermophila SB210]|uniref:Uncharacterized protein n=1 Tax=Tetrahymena thermophila (strain SB210) TaxID=312017 RepID=W7X0A1_TETTS|nr:hypothetical protein TTHERM_000951701 [Tetrahymena thermophila SB210]EWS72530.1 hypothetical protein TTHERM_000951701 [Tetrahymena thermophila SB210]|eukprot:XP_012654932.1 hypothetical protein TTHERM_000951701 [Tetrahymena thermophila SB210]